MTVGSLPAFDAETRNGADTYRVTPPHVLDKSVAKTDQNQRSVWLREMERAQVNNWFIPFSEPGRGREPIAATSLQQSKSITPDSPRTNIPSDISRNFGLPSFLFKPVNLMPASLDVNNLHQPYTTSFDQTSESPSSEGFSDFNSNAVAGPIEPADVHTIKAIDHQKPDLTSGLVAHLSEAMTVQIITVASPEMTAPAPTDVSTPLGNPKAITPEIEQQISIALTPHVSQTCESLILNQTSFGQNLPAKSVVGPEMTALASTDVGIPPKISKAITPKNEQQISVALTPHVSQTCESLILNQTSFGQNLPGDFNSALAQSSAGREVTGVTATLQRVTRSSGNPAIRLHVQWSSSDVNVWLGMDGTAAQTASQAAVIVQELLNYLISQGQNLGRVVCNGALVFDPVAGNRPPKISNFDDAIKKQVQRQKQDMPLVKTQASRIPLFHSSSPSTPEEAS